MRYYILIYQVVTDHRTFRGRVARKTMDMEGMVAGTKAEIADGYTKMHPENKSMDVSIVKVRETSMLEYLSFSKMARNVFNP